jgi:type VI secretion system protein ImpE
MSQATWEDALRSGDLSGALAAVKDSVRAKPGDGDLRLVLMHLAALTGEWESAVKQLKGIRGQAAQAVWRPRHR